MGGRRRFQAAADALRGSHRPGGEPILRGVHALRPYELGYETPRALPLRELADRRPPWLEIFGVDPYDEHRRVYGVRTEKERYALVQAIQVTDEYVTLRYRTYEKHLPQYTIMGGFSYESGGIVNPTDRLVGVDQIQEATRLFTPDARPASAAARDRVVERSESAVVEADLACRRPVSSLRPSRFERRPMPGPRPLPRTPRDPDLPDLPDRPDLPQPPEPTEPEPTEPTGPCEPVKTGPSRLPNYEIPTTRWVKRGRFVARTHGLSRPLAVQWSLDGEGQVTADGVELGAAAPRRGQHEVVVDDSVAELDHLDVEIEAGDGTTVSCSRCVELAGEKTIS